MAGRRSTRKKAKPAPKRTSFFKNIEITILGRDSHDPGSLGQVIGESFAMARHGVSGTFKVNGIEATVKVCSS